jgi:hypothetical protein
MRECAIVKSKASKRGLRYKFRAWLALSALVLTAACGGSLYKVKPVVEAPIAEGATGAQAGGITVRAMPLLSDEESFELFESNLLLAGILPVRIELSNQSGAPVDFKKARFLLRDAAGREWKILSAKQTVARILKADDNYLYNPNARAKFETELGAHAFDLKTPLAQGQQRRGLIFFQTPKHEAIASPRGLVLSIEKLPQNVELRLN